jgi:hypothetical protein
VILIRSLLAWLDENNSFSVFLPVAIKGFLAAIALGVPWLVWVLFNLRQGSQHKSSSKGATP